MSKGVNTLTMRGKINHNNIEEILKRTYCTRNFEKTRLYF